MPTPTTLRRLAEAPEFFLDSYVADGDSAVFLSLRGRDNAIHELMAKRTLPPGEGGWDSLSLMGERSCRLHLDRDRLAAHDADLPENTVWQPAEPVAV